MEGSRTATGSQFPYIARAECSLFTLFDQGITTSTQTRYHLFNHKIGLRTYREQLTKSTLKRTRMQLEPNCPRPRKERRMKKTTKILVRFE